MSGYKIPAYKLLRWVRLHTLPLSVAWPGLVRFGMMTLIFAAVAVFSPGCYTQRGNPQTTRRAAGGIAESGSNKTIERYRALLPDIDRLPTPKTPISPKFPSVTGEEEPQAILILAHIDSSGSVLEVVMIDSSGFESFDDAALAAVQETRFDPGIENGEPVPVWMPFRIYFDVSGM